MEVEYAYTVPTVDTFVLGGSFSESCRLDLDGDTEVVDMCGGFVKDSEDQDEDVFEKDIVLDSDDEGARDESVNGVKKECVRGAGGLSRRELISLPKRNRTPAGCFRRVSKKVREKSLLKGDSARSSTGDEEINACRTYLGNDIDSGCQDHFVYLARTLSRSPDKQQMPTKEKLNAVIQSPAKGFINEKESPLDKSKAKVMGDNANANLDESTESPSEALGFVENYLSNNDFGSVRDVETRSGNRIRSPPSLRSKGSYCLARRIYRGCNDSKFRTFDWVEEQMENREWTFSGKHKDSMSGFKGEKYAHVSVSKVSDKVDVQMDNLSCFQSKEKSPRNVSSPASVDRDSPHFNGTDTWGLSMQDVREVAEAKDTSDTYEVGLDTQMAAEAMEELINTPPLSLGVEHLGNTLVDSLNHVNKKSKYKQSGNPKEAPVGWSTKWRRSKSLKISPVKLCDDEIQKGDAAQLPVSYNMAVNKSRTSTMQQGKDGVDCNLHAKDTRDVVNKRRKLTIVHDNLHGPGLSGKLSKLNSDSSLPVTAGKTKRRGKLNMNVVGSCPSKNMWIHPKGRRTRVSQNSIRSTDHLSPIVPSVENSTEKCAALELEAQGEMKKLLVYTRKRSCSSERIQLGRSLKVAGYTSSPSVNNNEAQGRTEELLVYTRKRPCSSEIKDSGRSLNLTRDTSSPSVNGHVLSRTSPITDGNHIAKTQIHLCKSTVEHFSCSADTSGHTKLSELPNENVSTLQVRNVSASSKNPCEDPFKSPLSRELSRLGYIGSLPEILPKDSRRSKAVAKICVLFSQNLEISIVKRQKKIVAQLGYSVASCCSEATHFVADKFLRTRNLMEAIALGKPVVTHLWLESCKQAGYAIDEKSFILRDEKKEKEIGFSMPLTLSRASKRPLLKGCRVFITKNVKPSVDVINCLVKAVHGQVVQDIQSASSKDSMISDDLLILSSEEDYTTCVPLLTKGAAIYDSELLLNGIVTQKLDYQRHQMFKDFGVKSARGRRNGKTVSKPS